MNTLLIFFALPIAVIIISIALQKILKCPALVAAIIFAIFLIVTFIINNLNFLIAAIVYAIISFITAYIVCIICRFVHLPRQCSCFSRGCAENNRVALNTITNQTQNCGCGCNDNNNNDDDENCDGNWQVSGMNGISARVNIVPNGNTNGRTGSISGCYRRRC